MPLTRLHLINLNLRFSYKRFSSRYLGNMPTTNLSCVYERQKDVSEIMPHQHHADSFSQSAGARLHFLSSHQKELQC